MIWPAGSITDPTKFLEMPFILMERIGAFTIEIMRQAFTFANEVGRLIV